jgi:hypothetical protein
MLLFLEERSWLILSLQLNETSKMKKSVSVIVYTVALPEHLLLEHGLRSQAKIPKLQRLPHKAAQKGVVHKNNAARRKSRLMKQLAAKK